MIVFGCGNGDVAESVEQLKSHETQTRQSGARTLAEMKGERKESIPALVESLNDTDADVRRLSAAALGRQGTTAIQAVPELIERLNREDDRSARLAVAYAIVQIDPSRVEPLEVLMESVRRREVGSLVKLQQMGPTAKQAVPLLTDVLRDPRSIIRLQAVKALGAIGSDAQPALPTLRRLANDPDVSIRDATTAAIQSIEQSGGEE